MHTKEYNPYSEDNNISEAEEAPKKRSRVKRPSPFQRLKTFWENTPLRMLIGIIVAGIGLLMLISFISYFKTGIADQSAVLSANSIELAKSGEQIENIGASFGASISNFFIRECVGVAAFIIAVWVILIGMAIFGMKKIKFYPVTMTSVLLLIITSLVLGFLSINSESFFLWGGAFGRQITLFLMQWVGYPGVAIIYFILLFALGILWYGSIVRAWNKAKQYIPTIPAISLLHQEHSDNEDNTESKPTEPTKVEFNKDDNVNLVDSKLEVSPLHEAVEKTVFPDVEEEKPVGTTVSKQETEDLPSEEIPSDIRQADSIEKGQTSGSLPIIDPTDELPHYKFPPIDLLRDFEKKTNIVDIEEQENNKRRIVETLGKYGIEIKKIDACVGPTVTLFEIIPADGVKIAKIKNLEDDIALNLAARGIRIIAPIPGRGTIGIEIPNSDPQVVSMRSILESKKYQETKFDLPIAVGCTISNEIYIADLCKMPHLLVAGATGMGKSVGLNTIIMSLLYRKHPAELKFVLIDPKMVEFSLYSKIEHHYLAKLPDEPEAIITDCNRVISTLKSLTVEMDDRYKLLKTARCRNIKEYNEKYTKRYLNPNNGHRYLPYIVVIVDEFSDLIMMAGKEIEMPIARIAQKARAVGIHMIIATQRPDAKVITGNIKANFPGRIAFAVSSMVDSRTILDCSGAQRLIGKGDMLFLSGGNLERIQCAFIDTPEIESICDYIDNQEGYSEAYQLPEFNDIETSGEFSPSISGRTDRDPLFEDAAAFIVTGQTASTSSLQRHYSIGYNRAGKLMDQMEAAGIVGPSQGGKPRQVLVDSIQLTQMLGQ